MADIDPPWRTDPFQNIVGVKWNDKKGETPGKKTPMTDSRSASAGYQSDLGDCGCSSGPAVIYEENYPPSGPCSPGRGGATIHAVGPNGETGTFQGGWACSQYMTATCAGGVATFQVFALIATGCVDVYVRWMNLGVPGGFLEHYGVQCLWSGPVALATYTYNFPQTIVKQDVDNANLKRTLTLAECVTGSSGGIGGSGGATQYYRG